MINRNDPDTPRRKDPSNELKEHRYKQRAPERQFDDVIVSLANAYENKRARQVNEWEQMRARMVHRSS